MSEIWKRKRIINEANQYHMIKSPDWPGLLTRFPVWNVWIGNVSHYWLNTRELVKQITMRENYLDGRKDISQIVSW